MRIENTLNADRDFAFGRSLGNLAALHKLGFAANYRKGRVHLRVDRVWYRGLILLPSDGSSFEAMTRPERASHSHA